MVIYKYPIIGADVSPHVKIEMPRFSKVLSAGFDPNDRLCIWATVNERLEEAKDMVYKNIYCVGTGWPLHEIIDKDSPCYFIDTIKRGPYMWHIFEGKEEEIE